MPRCSLVRLLALASTVVAIAPDLQIQTTSGLVHGIYNDTAQTVRAFLGIPYAEAPINELRFSPPVAKSPISADQPIDASKFGPPCPQTFSYDNESIWSILPYNPWNTANISEDCLSVNVWTPVTSNTASQDEKKAVLMFVHGGAYMQGAGSVGFYDGSEVVKEHGDVLVVTFNEAAADESYDSYRLNVFGFPNAPGLNLADQNVGFLDQRLAVEWVHRNIANFGGDPDRILLFGQSAGSGSVDTYAYAYPDNPLVSAIALLSGTASILPNLDLSHSNWNNLSTALGCGSGEESLSCMRQTRWEVIVKEMGTNQYTPVYDNRTRFEDLAQRAKRGGVARVPTLGGITAREFSASIPLSSTEVDETTILEAVYNQFSCPLSETLKRRMEQDIPTWRYVYHGNFTNLSPTPWLGAYHSSELPMIFGTHNQSTLPSPTQPNEVAVSKYIQGALVAFAKDPENGLLDYGWPEFSFNGRTLVNLGVGNRPGAVLSSIDEWDAHCSA
ncbi:Alpha/Beta hydrolase protein [Aspergillus filifer]